MTLTGAKVSIVEDLESQDFGKVTTISVTAKTGVSKEEDSDKIPKIEIDKVQIGDETKARTKKDFTSPLELQMVEVLSSFYSLSKENVEVRIDEG